MAAIEVPTMDDSQLFLVRVWPPNPVFRASARRVDSDEPQLLNSPQELAEYVARASGAAPTAVPDSPCATRPLAGAGIQQSSGGTDASTP